jgi:hypothetical protein
VVRIWGLPPLSPAMCLASTADAADELDGGSDCPSRGRSRRVDRRSRMWGRSARGTDAAAPDDLACRILGLGFRIRDSQFMVTSGLKLPVWGVELGGFRVPG